MENNPNVKTNYILSPHADKRTAKPKPLDAKSHIKSISQQSAQKTLASLSQKSNYKPINSHLIPDLSLVNQKEAAAKQQLFTPKPLQKGQLAVAQKPLSTPKVTSSNEDLGKIHKFYQEFYNQEDDYFLFKGSHSRFLSANYSNY